ncbi:MAG: hypothetical protein M3458_01625 [Acidobacteriota bacterium]|nr:hypothetical protein [Acidobacteriota bacterium]
MRKTSEVIGPRARTSCLPSADQSKLYISSVLVRQAQLPPQLPKVQVVSQRVEARVNFETLQLGIMRGAGSPARA